LCGLSKRVLSPRPPVGISAGFALPRLITHGRLPWGPRSVSKKVVSCWRNWRE
jgi:hypothetical protein